MGVFIAKQPNGLYCRYSGIVDNITHHNMTEEEYIELCADRARQEAWEVLKDAKPFSEVLKRLYPDTKRDGYEIGSGGFYYCHITIPKEGEVESIGRTNFIINVCIKGKKMLDSYNISYEQAVKIKEILNL